MFPAVLFVFRCNVVLMFYSMDQTFRLSVFGKLLMVITSIHVELFVFHISRNEFENLFLSLCLCDLRSDVD